MGQIDPSTWAMLMATIVILAIIVLAFLAVFKPGPIAEWKIKVNGIEASGSSLLLGFAIVLLIVLVIVWPDFAEAIFRNLEAATKLLIEKVFH